MVAGKESMAIIAARIWHKQIQIFFFFDNMKVYTRVSILNAKLTNFADEYN